jgi:hypothetical protein
MRASYGFPFGSLSDENDFEDAQILFSSIIPLQFDVGVRLASGLELGAYAQWGFTQAKDFCSDCSGSDLRYGLQATWHFNVRNATMLPWIGVAFGRETFNLQLGPLDGSYSGWDGMLQMGADYRPRPCYEVGPVVALDVGVAKHLDVSAGDAHGSADIRYQSAHYWLTFGVRGAFGSGCSED